MYIEPAEYLDLTDRITVLSRKYETACEEKSVLSNKLIVYEERNRMLSQKITEMENEKLKFKDSLKEHVTFKAQSVMNHITSEQDKERSFIEEQILKLKNGSAQNRLKELEEKINENKLNSQEKELCQKIKTLYIINKKKAKCTTIQLFEWVKEMIGQAQQMILTEPSAGNVGISLKGISGTQRSSNNKIPAKTDKDKGKQNLPLAKHSSRLDEKQNVLKLLPQVKEELEQKKSKASSKKLLENSILSSCKNLENSDVKVFG